MLQQLSNELKKVNLPNVLHLKINMPSIIPLHKNSSYMTSKKAVSIKVKTLVFTECEGPLQIIYH